MIILFFSVYHAPVFNFFIYALAIRKIRLRINGWRQTRSPEAQVNASDDLYEEDEDVCEMTDAEARELGLVDEMSDRTAE